MKNRDNINKCALSDNEYFNYIEDPMTIPDTATCLELLGELDRSIANIKVQHAHYFAQNILDQNEEWFGRSQYALAMRRQEYHRVYQKYKMLSGYGDQHDYAPQTRKGRIDYTNILLDLVMSDLTEQQRKAYRATASNKLKEMKEHSKSERD